MHKIHQPKKAGYYIEKLGIQWPIEWFASDTEVTARIYSDGTLKKHEIILIRRKPPGAKRSKAEIFIPDVAHEVCHAHLAEQIDTAFSTTWLYKEYNVKRPWVKRRANGLYLAKSLEDIWVNDLRHTVHSKLIQQDLIMNGNAIVRLEKLSGTRVLEGLDRYVIIAQFLAQIKRQRANVSVRQVEEIVLKMSDRGQRIIRGLTGLYQGLPRLQFDREKDLQLMASSVKQATKILELQFPIELVDQKGKGCWKID